MTNRIDKNEHKPVKRSIVKGPQTSEPDPMSTVGGVLWVVE